MISNIMIAYPATTDGILTSSVEENGRNAACLGEVVIFTCMVQEATGVEWRSEAFTNPIVFVVGTHSQGDTMTRGDFHAVLTIEVADPVNPMTLADLTSTLTVTATSEVNGTVVECIAVTATGDIDDSKTLRITGELCVASDPLISYYALLYTSTRFPFFP